MYIANAEETVYQSSIIEYIPKNIRRFLYNIDLSKANEIHLGVDKPLCIYFYDGYFFINRSGNLTKNIFEAVKTSHSDILKTLELVTGASIYSLTDEISNGFVTISGGHRVGLCGSGVIRDGEVSYLKDICGLNFRIANEHIGVSDKVIDIITNGDTVKNTLFVSSPGAGKTTMLRDCSRNLSNMGFRVSIVDERREIAAMRMGKSPFDLGISTDVLSGIDKKRGMMMMLRSMSPQVIITDELGGDEDIKTVNKMLSCGISVISSIHGSNDLMGREKIYKDFDNIIILSKRNGPGTIEEVIKK